MTEDFAKELSGIKSQSLIYIFDSITKDYIYKNRDMNSFYEQIREMVPAECEFFIAWFKGFVVLAEWDFENAKNFYLSALENAHFASDYLPQFLQQGFALFMYCDDRETALKFWNFGVGRGLFAHATEKFFASFDSKEQFWVQFAPNMFVNSKKIEKIVISDYTKVCGDEVKNSIDSADFSLFEKVSEKIDFDSYRIDGVSVLYYAIARKGTVAGGEKKFTDNLVNVRSSQLLSQLDLSLMSDEMKNAEYMNILHQIRVTFERSGLAHLMFIASCGEEKESFDKVASLEKIISLCAEKTSDVDSFTRQIEGKMGTNALHLAAELDDCNSVRILLEKGADNLKTIGYAVFGVRKSDGVAVSTSVPNSLVYRLISFKSWNVLKLYLNDFKKIIKSSMTDKNEKCNITPLVYLILNTLYSSKNEAEYGRNKAFVDEVLPLFVEAGSSLDENTAFGTAKKLLGMK